MTSIDYDKYGKIDYESISELRLFDTLAIDFPRMGLTTIHELVSFLQTFYIIHTEDIRDWGITEFASRVLYYYFVLSTASDKQKYLKKMFDNCISNEDAKNLVRITNTIKKKK